jgi:catechol 2,3-dioxygenase-like lactoylglutathione lyase family enzyme
MTPAGGPRSASGAADTIKATGLDAIRHMDYVVIFARDLPAMRHFYETVMRFPIYHEKFPRWIEYRVGATLLALTQKGVMFDDPGPPQGVAALQLAFRVAPEEVNTCFAQLKTAGVVIVAEPTDQPWGHRTLFCRDPDGNIIEIYADL